MSGSVSPLVLPTRKALQTVFHRTELALILDIYGRMVAAGKWRDYAIDHEREFAVFSAFRRASERPEVQVWKRPQLRVKQQTYALVGEGGVGLKRGPELGPVLAPLARKLVKLGE